MAFAVAGQEILGSRDGRSARRSSRGRRSCALVIRGWARRAGQSEPRRLLELAAHRLRQEREDRGASATKRKRARSSRPSAPAEDSRGPAEDQRRRGGTQYVIRLFAPREGLAAVSVGNSSAVYVLAPAPTRCRECRGPARRSARPAARACSSTRRPPSSSRNAATAPTASPDHVESTCRRRRGTAAARPTRSQALPTCASLKPRSAIANSLQKVTGVLRDSVNSVSADRRQHGTHARAVTA